jgi:hypothetical protein
MRVAYTARKATVDPPRTPNQAISIKRWKKTGRSADGTGVAGLKGSVKRLTMACMIYFLTEKRIKTRTMIFSGLLI